MMGLFGWTRSAAANIAKKPWPRFDRTSLAHWFDRVADRLPPALQAQSLGDRLLQIDAILQATDGIPERVYERLCAEAGVRWSEVQAIARARFEPPATVSAGQALQALAREYDRIRDSQAGGAARTLAMHALVQRMRPLLADIPESVASTWSDDASAGMRLLRVRWLHEQPAASQCAWLAQCVAMEKPFVAYHALLALQQAAHLLPQEDLDTLLQALASLEPTLARLDADTDRKHAYDEALQVLSVRLQNLWLLAASDAHVLPGRDAAWRGNTRLARATRDQGRIWCGEERTGSVGTGAEVLRMTDGDWRIVGRERARVVEVAQEADSREKQKRLIRVRIEPCPDDPPPPVPEAGWARLRSALRALARLCVEMQAPSLPLAGDDIDELYAGLEPAIHADMLWAVYTTQDRAQKLEIAFAAVTREIEWELPRIDASRNRELRDIVAHLFTTPDEQQRVALRTLEESHPRRPVSWPPPLTRERLARALALRPDDEALWAALQSTSKRAKPKANPLRLWPNGSTLRLRFIGGDRFRRERVLSIAREWFEHANLKLEVLPVRSKAEAELRVAFDLQAGSWSYVGTNARAMPPNEPTMNLGWVGPDSDDNVARHAILKEFGHALGLIPELQNPNRAFEWNEEVAISEMSGPPNFWNLEMIRTNLMDTYAPFDYRPFDPRSVMLFEIPAHWVKSGQAMGGATELSESDKALIARLYPRTATGRIAPAPKPARTTTSPKARPPARK
jgi:hypothetical protein